MMLHLLLVTIAANAILHFGLREFFPQIVLRKRELSLTSVYIATREESARMRLAIVAAAPIS